MGRFGLRINFPVKMVNLQVVLLDGWSGPTETSRSISKNFRFQSYLAKQQSKFRSKRKWIVSMRLKTLFQ